jgi:tetrapyrrole methylase family protein/MazG family protein
MRLLEAAEEVMVRTSRHPCIEDLRARGVNIRPMDRHYQENNTMEEVYSSVVREVVEEAEAKGEAYYATPGLGLLAERTVQLLLEEEVELRIHAAVSFLDAVLAALRLDAVEGVLLLDGDRLVEKGYGLLDPRVGTLIAQVDSRIKASEVKLALLEVYPPGHTVRVVAAAGTERERVDDMALEELDREERFDHLTTIYVPAMREEDILDFQRLLDVVGAPRRGGGGGGGPPPPPPAPGGGGGGPPGGPPGGCPWDRKQTHESLARHMVEEAHEAVDAIHRADWEHLSEELGDLLLQVALHAQLGSEEGTFDIRDTLGHIIEKLVRRHPHVFGELELETPEDVIARWERIKAEERGKPSALDGLAEGLPALVYAFKMQTRAARVGFDWGKGEEVLPKLGEELAEIEEVLRGGCGDLEDELGDMLFTLVNVCRHYLVDPEVALRRSARKFMRRFQAMEERCRDQGLRMEEMSLEELDRLWEASKEE